jgi:hypothetical protein
MKYDPPDGGCLYPDKGPRDTIFHKAVLRAEPVPNTLCGHWLDLECGHRVMAFGDLAHAGGVVLCDQCLANSRKVG